MSKLQKKPRYTPPETGVALALERAPHIRVADTYLGMNGDVLMALTPAAVFGVVLFGLRALTVLVLSLLGALVGEVAGRLVTGRSLAVRDASAAVTGLLFGMSLSSAVPLWIPAAGGFLATFLFKHGFGGLGKNPLNPAVASRLVWAALFPKPMGVFYQIGFAGADTVSSATPVGELAVGNTEAFSLHQLVLGLHPGTVGETSALLLLCGGVYLLLRRVVRWEIPLAATVVFGALLVLFPVTDQNRWLFFAESLASGGVMLSVFFLLPDPVTSPLTRAGRLVYGSVFGLLLFLLRSFSPGGEGVTVAVLTANLLARPCDRLLYRIRKRGEHGVAKS